MREASDLLEEEAPDLAPSLNRLFRAFERTCKLVVHGAFRTSHIGTVIKMAVESHFDKLMFYARRGSPFIEELQDGSKYQDGFFSGKSIICNGTTFFVGDIQERDQRSFRMVEIFDLWNSDISSFTTVCRLEGIDGNVVLEADRLELAHFSLSQSAPPSVNRVKSGGLPYYTLSLILFTDDLGTEPRQSSPAESMSIVLGNLPK